MSKSTSKRLLVSFLSLLLCLFIFHEPAKAYNNGYYIKNYDVAIEVHEDNTYDITETLDVWYDEAYHKHGIVRSIPLSNTVERKDGSTSKNRAVISNVSVDTEFETYKEDGFYNIQIGSADRYVAGDVRYVIRYTYDIGRDKLLTSDEFYFNIVGNEWDTSIMSTDFSVHFPKEFTYTEETLGFSHGYRGSDNYQGIYYKVENDTVYGYFHEELTAGEGLNMRLTLPEGYFVRGNSIWDYLVYVGCGLPFIGFFFIWFLYQRYGKNGPVVEPVEFYPPEDMNPAEIGYYYDNSLDTKDITSLLTYLASIGCLKIEEVGKSYHLHLVQYPEGEKQEVTTFYDGLMKYAVEEDGDYIVKETSLENRFYKTINAIRSNFSSAKRRKEVVVPTGKYKFLAAVSGILTIFVSVYTLMYSAIGDYVTAAGTAGFIAVMACVYVPILMGVFSSAKRSRISLFMILFVLAHAVFFVGIFGAVFFASDMPLNLKLNVTTILGIVGIILSIATIVLGMKMFKRTERGNEIYGRIAGFRNFLEKAEKNQLEMLVEEDPTYFYDILPYAYVLGVSSKWIKKFDGIAMEPPEWYYGYTSYDRMNHRIEDSMNSLSSSMRSEPHSSSGSSGGGFSSSGSSGGGFSGGGSGGGGGHSW